MKRGELVVAAFFRESGKPRPALVVQTDALLHDPTTIALCPLTSDVQGHAYRLVLEVSPENGLEQRSEVMIDKLAWLVPSRISRTVGVVEAERMREVDRALAFFLGLRG